MYVANSPFRCPRLGQTIGEELASQAERGNSDLADFADAPGDPYLYVVDSESGIS